MAEELLDGSNVDTAFEVVGGAGALKGKAIASATRADPWGIFWRGILGYGHRRCWGEVLLVGNFKCRQTWPLAFPCGADGPACASHADRPDVHPCYRRVPKIYFCRANGPEKPKPYPLNSALEGVIGI